MPATRAALLGGERAGTVATLGITWRCGNLTELLHLHFYCKLNCNTHHTQHWHAVWKHLWNEFLDSSGPWTFLWKGGTLGITWRCGNLLHRASSPALVLQNEVSHTPYTTLARCLNDTRSAGPGRVASPPRRPLEKHDKCGPSARRVNG